MELPKHIVDLVCSLEEQDVDDNEIIRWCLCFLDSPQASSEATLYLELADRSINDIGEALASISSGV